MAISNFQIHEWRKEYLQELKDTLTRAASNGYYEQLMKKSTPEDLAEATEDDILFIEFLYKKLIPYLEFMAFQDRNNSLKDRPEAVDGESYPRYTMSEVFDYISGMTNYGKYHVVNQFPGDDVIFEELRDAIFMNDKDAFLSTIKEKSVDFSSFRERISASMFLASWCNELKDRYLIGVLGNPDCFEDTEKMEKEHKEISEYGNFMIEHVSKPAYNVITDVYETFEGFIKMGEEDNIDEEKIQLVSCLHFSDSELWGLFLGTAYYFGFISFVIEDSFTNSELAILNEFLDDPHTNRILNDMERALYVMTEGEIFPKKIFIPQSVRDEIESGRINDAIRQLNSGLKEVDEQEQPVEKNDALPGEQTQEPEGEGSPKAQPEATHSDGLSSGETFPTFFLPRDENWTKCDYYKTSSDNHYIKTSLQSARMVTQDQIESLFYALVNVGCLDNKEDVLLALAVRLTGRKLLPEPIPPIEWLGEPAELDYLIFRLTPEKQKPQYARYKHFYKDYNPDGAARRAVSGYVREAVIECLNGILPTKERV